MKLKALFAILALGASTATLADPIATNQWYSFGFAGDGSSLAGAYGDAVDPASIGVPNGPWTFTLSGPGMLEVTDLEESGDWFTFFDNGSSIGTTSTPTWGDEIGEDIGGALADSNFSRGFFVLGAGDHSITGVLNAGSVGNGDGAFIVNTAVPEPASLALLSLGLLGVGLMRRKNKQ
jgi:hypothetical protein